MMNKENPTGNYPQYVLKTHTSDILQAVTEADRLAMDLWSASLLSDTLKDNIINNVGLSRLQKAIKILDEVYRCTKEHELLVKFCAILKKQSHPTLTQIADVMLEKLG